jgi:hypothetical protein
MDLLGHLREEAGNEEAACRKGLHGAERRNAQALLLARLPSPLKDLEAALRTALALLLLLYLKPETHAGQNCDGRHRFSDSSGGLLSLTGWRPRFEPARR